MQTSPTMKSILQYIEILILCSIPSISCDDIIVQVAQGKLSGTQQKTVVGNKLYYSFKGIPYAKPPIGDLRFKAPQDPEPWEGVWNATAHGNVCPQYNPLNNVFSPGSEDCLFLNLYTPNLKPTTPLPVLFYIFGGAFLIGSGDDDLHGPDFLIRKDVIVVTINYRLEALGFLCLDNKEVPGNAGLKDQVAALRWVQKNIDKFGGCPNNVTIMGGSSGGASVGYHLISPMSKGLFHRAIAMSGAPPCDCLFPYQPKRRAFTLGKMLGLETKNTTELLEFLQSVPVDQLVNVKPTVLASEEITNVLLKLEYFAPVVETNFCNNNNFITEEPFKTLQNKNINDADVMFSYNNQEALVITDFYEDSYIEQYNRYPEMFVPSKILLNARPNTILQTADKIIEYYFGNKTVSVENMAEFLNYASMAGIAYDVQRYFRRISENVKTYFFKFSYYSSRNFYGQAGAKYGIFKAGHFDDLFYLFHSKLLNMTLEENTKEYKMVENIVTAVTNFAKYGNPSPLYSSLGVDWSEFNTKTLAYVNFGDELSVGAAADEEDMQFWQSIFEYAGMIF